MLTLSPATLVSFARQASSRLLIWEENIKAELLSSHVLHADEVLPYYARILSHDFWPSYSDFDVVHAPCHSHLQRELTKVYEDYEQKWANDLADLLLKANEERDKADGELSYNQIKYPEEEIFSSSGYWRETESYSSRESWNLNTYGIKYSSLKRLRYSYVRPFWQEYKLQ
ncbi:MAG: transposase [Bacteriovorax sp.]|nr:transposase [Bacteriovorax sp.]